MNRKVCVWAGVLHNKKIYKEAKESLWWIINLCPNYGYAHIEKI